MYKTTKYVILNYVFSWGLFVVVILLALGLNMSFLSDGDSLIMGLITVVYCWMPNIVLILFFKKLGMNMTVKEFYKNELRARVNVGILLEIFMLQVAVCALSAGITAMIDGVEFITVFGIPKDGILASAFFCLFTGATGEESGWRGFLLKGYRQKYILLISSIFTGMVWAFWHLPIWLLSGYIGAKLIIYISAFLVSLIAFTIIMMFYYDKCKNIVVLVFFHYMINFVLSFYMGNDLLYQMLSAVIYAIIATVIVLTHKELYLKK